MYSIKILKEFIVLHKNLSVFIYFFSLGNQASLTKIFNNFTQNSHGVYETPLKLYEYITLQNLNWIQARIKMNFRRN